MRRKVWILVLVVATVAAPVLSLAEDAGAGPLGKTIPPDKRESLRRLTALFIITLLVLLVMIVVMIVLGLLLRRSRRALEERGPEGPTELEDLWWQVNLPEEDKKD